jgi:hypothetical protein
VLNWELFKALAECWALHLAACTTLPTLLCERSHAGSFDPCNLRAGGLGWLAEHEQREGIAQPRKGRYCLPDALKPFSGWMRETFERRLGSLR